MGTFTHNNKTYPRLEFWQITAAYFKTPENVNQIIRLPCVWIHLGRNAERHFSDTQIERILEMRHVLKPTGSIYFRISMRRVVENSPARI